MYKVSVHAYYGIDSCITSKCETLADARWLKQLLETNPIITQVTISFDVLP